MIPDPEDLAGSLKDIRRLLPLLTGAKMAEWMYTVFVFGLVDGANRTANDFVITADWNPGHKQQLERVLNETFEFGRTIGQEVSQEYRGCSRLLDYTSAARSYFYEPQRY